MDIHPGAAPSGVTRENLHHAAEHARLTTHIGNAPTRLLIVGEDDTGRLLELTAVVRHEDVLVVHADTARASYRSLLDELALPSHDDGEFGRAADGVVLTDELVHTLFEQAVSGYDVDSLLDRTRPG